MHSFKGIVEKGKGRGKALGFPTANIPLHDPDISGVYVAEATIDSKKYRGAAFADQTRKLLEVYIIDLDKLIYGVEISIELLEKIRERAEFHDDETLKKQIAADIAAVNAHFQRTA